MITIPELSDLYPSPFLPGETPTLTGKPLAIYSPDGALLSEDMTGFSAYLLPHRMDRANHFVSRPFFRSGVGFWVSTVYLGMDHNWTPGQPIRIWETMIASDEGWLGFQRRYSTRNAALSAHRQVVHTVRQAQRVRRLRNVLTAPRHASPRAWAPVIHALT
jgi:hypothetical protein